MLKTDELIRFEDLSDNTSLVELRKFVAQEGLNVKAASKADLYRKIKDAVDEESLNEVKAISEVLSQDETLNDEMKQCFHHYWFHLKSLFDGYLYPVRVARNPQSGEYYTQMKRRDNTEWTPIVHVSRGYTLISNETAISVTLNSIKAVFGSYPKCDIYRIRRPFERWDNTRITLWMEHDQFPHIDLAVQLKGLISDRVRLVILMHNSYDKTSAFRLEIVSVRDICSSSAFIYKQICPPLRLCHYKQNNYVDIIREYLGELFERFSKMTALWKEWTEEVVGDEYHKNFREELCEEQFTKLNEFVDQKRPDGTTCTKWEFFNHVTYYTTHILKDPYFIDSENLRTRLIEFFYGKEDDDSDFDNASIKSESSSSEDDDDDSYDKDDDEDDQKAVKDADEEDISDGDMVNNDNENDNDNESSSSRGEDEEDSEEASEEEASDDEMEDDYDDEDERMYSQRGRQRRRLR